MKQRIWIFLWCITSLQLAVSQIGNKGVPNIRNFTYEQYRAGAQNHSILQDSEGNMLFGNNYGLLQYNGKDWHLIAQPSNKTVVWSLHQSRDSTIYLGAQNDLGYIRTHVTGQKQYTSLLPKIPTEYRQFSDVWAILETSSGVYFHTGRAIYRYHQDTMTVLQTPALSSFSKVGDSILVQDAALNIHTVRPDGLTKVIDGKEVGKYVLKIYADQHGGLLMVTQHHGLLRYLNGKFEPEQQVVNPFFEQHRIHTSLQLRNDYLAIGSVGGGLLILDAAFRPVQWLSKSNGLQSNTILAMATDHIGNLWVATESGIDYVEIATPLYRIGDEYGLEGSISTTLHDQGILYAGTNTGVFYSRWEENENPLDPKLHFQQVPGISGQVWKLYKLGGSVYACHHDGLYLLHQKREAEALFSGTGAWNLLPISGKPGWYLQGAYDGIHLYRLVNDRLSYQWKIKGFDETSRILEMDDQGILWMAHGYKGIYRLKADADWKVFTESRLYRQEDGFPTSLFINLFKVNNKIVFGTEYGVYQYLQELDSMLPDPLYATILGTGEHVRLLRQEDGNVWFLKGQDMQDILGVIDFYDNERYEVTVTPLQLLRGRFNPGFESIHPVDKNTVLFGTKNGIVLYDRGFSRDYTRPYQAKITEVRSIVNDSLLYGQTAINPYLRRSETGSFQLPYKLNAVSFRYASNYFESPEHTRYACYLEGFDADWYEWGTEQSRRYTNLSPGKYTFRVKAMNIYGYESRQANYSFTILPPWYLSTAAKASYGCLLLLLGATLLKGYRLRIEAAQKKERLTQLEIQRKSREEHEAEKLITRQELMTLRNEKLEAEIEISQSRMEVLNAEMAASIMMITQKNSLLMKVRDDLGKLLKNAKDSNKKTILRMIHHIDKDMDTEQDWLQFKIHFDKVHEDFLERLKCQFPEITAKDLQLAAYLRLNLSSKEIASMMNITLRSVEGCRYRLRKHLHLSGETNLNEFILKF